MAYEQAIWYNQLHEKSNEHLYIGVKNNKITLGTSKEGSIICVIKNKGFLSKKLRFLNGMNFKSEQVAKRIAEFINTTKNYHAH